MIILIILVLIIIFILKHSTKVKGAVGEFKSSIKLSFLNKSEYHVLNDVMILAANNKTFQIDHLVLSVYGIFIIETKNYKGWIFGNERSEYWTQVIYKEKNKFYNPIKQNRSHVYALKSLLSNYKEIKYYPIVVFVGSGEIKEIESSVPVIYKYQLNRTIRNLSENHCLSIQQIEEIEDIILSNKPKQSNIMKEHINEVRDEIIRKEFKESNLICPKCNSKLVLRKGKYGKFYGCSNYPHCKYTMKV